MAKIIIGTNDTNMAPAFVKEVGGVSPVINSLTITPTTSSQSIIAPSGVDGYSPITVSAVDSSIDQNIVASNIKDGVTILGITGNYTGTAASRFGVTLDNFIGDVDSNGRLSVIPQLPSITFENVESITGTRCCQYAFSHKNFVPQATISFPDLTTISGYYACYHMFDGVNKNVSHITADKTIVDLSKLETISGSSACEGMFYEAYGVKQFTFTNLRSVSGSYACRNMFYNSTDFNSINFPSLTTVSTADAFVDMFLYTFVTAIHFRADARSVIEGLNDYSNKFGASNATIYFDL